MGSTLVHRLTQGVLRMLRLCSAILRLSLGSAPICSPSVQVKAVVAHVRRLKRNQRKGKLILSLGVLKVLRLSFIMGVFRSIPPACRISSIWRSGCGSPHAIAVLVVQADDSDRAGEIFRASFRGC
jgi:hypothetical protein